MPATIKIPDDLADLFRDGQRVSDAFALLNALATMEVHLVTPGAVDPLGPGGKPIRGDPPNLILTLPLKIAAPIANSTATAASASARLNDLLAALRVVKILPE